MCCCHECVCVCMHAKIYGKQWSRPPQILGMGHAPKNHLPIYNAYVRQTLHVTLFCACYVNICANRIYHCLPDL